MQLWPNPETGKPATHADGPTRVDGDRIIYLAKDLANVGDEHTVVYINGNPLDNRRENLVVMTNLQYQQMLERDAECDELADVLRRRMYRPRHPRHR